MLSLDILLNVTAILLCQFKEAYPTFHYKGNRETLADL